MKPIPQVSNNDAVEGDAMSDIENLDPNIGERAYRAKKLSKVRRDLSISSTLSNMINISGGYEANEIRQSQIICSQERAIQETSDHPQ